MKKVKKHISKHHTHISHTRTPQKKKHIWIIRYRFAVAGFICLLLSVLTWNYVHKGQVLSLAIDKDITNNSQGTPIPCQPKSFCDYKEWCIVTKTCKETCSYVDGRCGYKKPTPTPTPKGYQAQKCNTKTFSYQIFGPESLKGSVGSTNTNLPGKITASVCTDEVYNTKSKARIVEIKTNVGFDKIAQNAASCNGQPPYDPVTNVHPYDIGTYPPAGPGARLLIYVDDFSDLTNPDDRKMGLKCPGSQTVYQVSPDAFFNNRVSVGQRLMGRLSFSVNFGSYGYPLTIDVTGPQIIVK